jgi:hypothetical protein
VLKGTGPIVVVLGVVLLAGCGSSRLSHVEFVKRANAICTTYDAEAKKLPRPNSVTEIETYARRSLARYRAALAQLEALKPPQEDEVTVGQWLATDRKIAKDVEAIATAARARKIPDVQVATAQAAADNVRSDRLAGELGLTSCSKS